MFYSQIMLLKQEIDGYHESLNRIWGHIGHDLGQFRVYTLRGLLNKTHKHLKPILRFKFELLSVHMINF